MAVGTHLPVGCPVASCTCKQNMQAKSSFKKHEGYKQSMQC